MERATDDGADALLTEAGWRARGYLAGIGDRAVAPSPHAVAGLGRLDFPLPGGGLDPAAVLRLLDEAGSPATVASAGPRYFGFVTGGALPVAVAATWLLAAWDQNAALSVMSPAAARLDDVALRWVTELLGLPAGAGGGFVTGATMANVTCLAAARDAVLTAAGWDAAADGLVGAPPVQVVAGAEAHASVVKALGLVGLGRDRALRLPVDDQGRIIAAGLPELTGPAIVCLQAGNVNSGASDPFGPLIEWARAQGAWVHVDGAFGLWAAAAPGLAGEVAGVAGADSWATDAHKWLNTTYDCGIALVRDPGALRAAMRADAAYLPAGEARAPMLFTPQSSQRARGAEVWAVLAALGRDGLAELLERHVGLARRMAARLAAGGVEIRNEVRLNQVVAGFGDDEQTDAVIAAVQRGGTCWCGPTTWHGRRAMRISVSNWATTEDDVERSAAAILAAYRTGQAG
ncbi:MAG TPA: pyridoxal-dependent decarboxylase [Trebonia sp.]|jgi:glutamate/tyrosine decarboxylase-like PLP-dependent enzyme|nr:pyridoxal-dependent decarboxylase [Trebonia sp.]